MDARHPTRRPAARPRYAISDPRLLPRQRRIALLSILVPSAGVLAALGLVLARGFTRLDLAFLAGGVFLGQLALELGYHRLFAHRAFETTRWMRVLLATGASAGGQGRLLHWVANHRRHHVTSDTPDDPHSPHVRTGAGGPEHMGVLRGLVHAQWGHMLTDGVPNCTLFAKDLAADPGLRRVNALYVPIVVAGLLLPAALGAALTGDAWGALSGFLWGGLVRMFIVQNVTWSVASACHRFGAAPFDAGDESRNLPWAALASFGSGWQNNHHAFPHAAVLGMRWWEVDVGGLALRALAVLGLAWDLRKPSAEDVRARRRPTAACPERAS
jgi:stearoyl-CoA desaturase (delta-9 desaturase)